MLSSIHSSYHNSIAVCLSSKEPFPAYCCCATMVTISFQALVVAFTATALPCAVEAFGGVGLRPSSSLTVGRLAPRSFSLTSTPSPLATVEADTSDMDASSNKDAAFVNKSPMAWMNPYLDSLGIKEGKTLTYGVFAQDLDQTVTTPEDVAVNLRQKAAVNIENIGMEERKRRDQVGDAMWVVTFAYAIWSSLFADDGGVAGHFLRFLVILPAFLAVGYKVSADKGVCNIAQAGLWDVDGNGLKKIEDPTIAQAILEKVNAMNLEVALTCFAGSAIFGLLPQSTTAPLGIFAAAFAGT